MRRLAVIAVAALTALSVPGCSDDSSGTDRTPLTVSAASSLTEAFGVIEAEYEDANPDVDLVVNFGSSTTLAQQIVDGADVDVIVPASTSTMDDLVAGDDVTGDTPIIARNRLTIVVPAGNPSGVAGLADLEGLDVVALCEAEVPCGKFAAEVLDAAGITLHESHVTRGQDVKATVTAVSEGDAEAGIVYETDLLASEDRLDGVLIPDGVNAIASYPAGVVASSTAPDAASAFVDHLASAPAQGALRAAGFLPP